MVATLSISGSLERDCSNVVDAMRSLGIAGDVTPNQTILDGGVENGCRIVVASRPYREKAERLWDKLRQECKLTCAHVSVREDAEEGCVMDVFRPSLCPGRVKGATQQTPREVS